MLKALLTPKGQQTESDLKMGQLSSIGFHIATPYSSELLMSRVSPEPMENAYASSQLDKGQSPKQHARFLAKAGESITVVCVVYTLLTVAFASIPFLPGLNLFQHWLYLALGVVMTPLSVVALRNAWMKRPESWAVPLLGGGLIMMLAAIQIGFFFADPLLLKIMSLIGCALLLPGYIINRRLNAGKGASSLSPH